MDLEGFRDYAAAEQGLVIVSSARADGTIHSTLVNAGVMDHPVTGVPVVAIVLGGRIKLGHLRARPWITVSVRSGWRFATVEGTVELAGPDDDLPGVDDVPTLLREIFTAAGGTHDDWAEYDRVMAADRRAAVLVTPTRIYGT